MSQLFPVREQSTRRSSTRTHLKSLFMTCTRRFAPWLLLSLLAVTVALLSPLLPTLAPIDLGHYMQASRLILGGEIPYRRVEFFGPPWFAFFVVPFLLMPSQAAGSLWVLLSVLAVSGTAIESSIWQTFPRRGVIHTLAIGGLAVAPPALYVYITGQISGVVGFALVHLARSLNLPKGESKLLGIALAFAVMTLKPHIVLLPALLCILQLLRLRAWKSMAAVLFALAGLVFLASIVVSGWPTALLQALREGAFRGGPGLVARGYVGLWELGVPIWLLVLPGIYACAYWWKQGLTPMTVALAIAANLIVAPYSRAYDHVLLVLPALVAASPSELPRLNTARALAFTSFVLLPLTPVALLAPALMMIALLVRIRIERRQQPSRSPTLDASGQRISHDLPARPQRRP